jgi:acyl carrier protein
VIDFKVPSQFVFVEEIPKGPTGKLQRIGLATVLGVAAPSRIEARQNLPFKPPSTPVEKVLADIWEEVLGRKNVGVDDPFIDLGGDSMLATQIVSRVRDALRVEVTLQDMFDTPTVASLSLLIEEKLLEEVEALSEDEAKRLHDG